MTPGRFAVLALFAALNAVAQDYGPDTCLAGYVWREAFPADHVCVLPETRTQAARDNASAAQRREPAGGAYGPDTCRSGFVWRDARPGDHVCVTPDVRSQAASDNQLATSRRVASAAPKPWNAHGAAVVVNQPHVLIPTPPPSTSPAPASQGGSVRRGFDDQGRPYVQETLSDGSIRREQSNGVTITRPDGTSQFYPTYRVMMNAPEPTPPALPSDPAGGGAWLNWHNAQLLELIDQLVGGDQSEMQKFNAAEGKAVGSDLFGQISYRTRILEELTKL